MICLFVMRGRSERDGGCDGVFDGDLQSCDEVCDGACDSVTELCGARPELIMTGPGAVTHYQPGPGSVLPSLSSPRWCVMYMWGVDIHTFPPLCPRVKTLWTVCLASDVAVEDWWLLLLIEYNIKCRQSMRVCISQWSVDYNITPGTQRHASPAQSGITQR